MRVWQAGGHLMSERGAKVEDWSWARTRRRIAALARLAAPYKVRTTLSIFSLLAATATALAPPFLSKYAVDDGIRRHDLTKLWWIVGAFLVAGLANWGMSYVQTYLTGWVGERILADLRNKRSEEHTSELQSLAYLVCRLLLEKKKKKIKSYVSAR